MILIKINRKWKHFTLAYIYVRDNVILGTSMKRKKQT